MGERPLEVLIPSLYFWCKQCAALISRFKKSLNDLEAEKPTAIVIGECEIISTILNDKLQISLFSSFSANLKGCSFRFWLASYHMGG